MKTFADRDGVQPQPPVVPTPTPQRKRFRRRRILAGFFGVLVLIIIIAAVAGGGGSKPNLHANIGQTPAVAHHHHHPAKPAPKPATHHASTFASGHASGDFAVASAAGNIDPDGPISVVVKASPDQSMTVSWDVVCAEGFGSAGSKSGQYTARSGSRAILLPSANASSCTVSTNAQLNGSGNLAISVRG